MLLVDDGWMFVEDIAHGSKFETLLEIRDAARNFKDEKCSSSKYVDLSSSDDYMIYKIKLYMYWASKYIRYNFGMLWVIQTVPEFIS